jgi:hypothetical protein
MHKLTITTKTAEEQLREIFGEKLEGIGQAKDIIDIILKEEPTHAELNQIDAKFDKHKKELSEITNKEDKKGKIIKRW